MPLLSDFPGVEASGEFLKIHFTWDKHPEGTPKRQKARTHLRNKPEHYPEAALTLSLIKHQLASSSGLTVDEYVKYLPNSQLAYDIKNKTSIQRVEFIDAVTQYHDYCDHLARRNILSPETVKRYVRCLKGINFRPLHAKNVCDLTRKDFHDRQLGWEGHATFMQKGEEPKGPKTINNNITAIKHFGKWAMTNRLTDDPVWDVLEPRSFKMKPTEVFTPKQMTEIFVDLYQHESPDAANAFALLCLLGCRVGEVIALAEEDIKHPLSDAEIKERKRRKYPVSDIEKMHRIEIKRSLALEQRMLTDEEIEAQMAKPLQGGKKKRAQIWESETVHYIKDTKTHDIRILELDELTREILEEQITRHGRDGPRTYAVQVDERKQGQDLTFLIWNTRPITKKLLHGSDQIGKAYRRARTRLGYTSETMPALQKTRNTKASVMASNGEPMSKIRAQLGHGNDTQTLEKHYARWIASGERIDLSEIFRAARQKAKRKASGLKVVAS